MIVLSRKEKNLNVDGQKEKNSISDPQKGIQRPRFAEYARTRTRAS